MRRPVKGEMGVSPVIAVILMVAITIVLAGVVFIWAGSFTNETEEEPHYYNVKLTLTTDEGSPPTQNLRVEIMEGRINWEDFNVKIEEVDLATSYDEDRAGDDEYFPVPDSSTPTGGIDLSIGISYSVKIVSIDQNRIVYDDDIICVRG